MVNELHPLPDPQVMDRVHGHVALAGITTRDLVDGCLGLKVLYEQSIKNKKYGY